MNKRRWFVCLDVTKEVEADEDELREIVDGLMDELQRLGWGDFGIPDIFEDTTP